MTALPDLGSMTMKHGECVFCRTVGPLSEEDVIPRWLSKILPGYGEKLEMFVYDWDGNLTRRYKSNRLKVTTIAPCEQCNNGWMSDLENTKAGPLLKPMVLGQPTSLGADQQKLVALWAAKTVVCHALTTDDPPVPPEDFHWIYDNRQPPPNTWIRLAAYSGEVQSGQVHQQGLALTGDSSSADGYTTTLTINHLVVQVTVVHYFEPISWDSRAARGASLQIWPVNHNLKRWPPVFRLTDATLRKFYRSVLTKN